MKSLLLVFPLLLGSCASSYETRFYSLQDKAPIYVQYRGGTGSGPSISTDRDSYYFSLEVRRQLARYDVPTTNTRVGARTILSVSYPDCDRYIAATDRRGSAISYRLICQMDYTLSYPATSGNLTEPVILPSSSGTQVRIPISPQDDSPNSLDDDASDDDGALSSDSSASSNDPRKFVSSTLYAYALLNGLSNVRTAGVREDAVYDRVQAELVLKLIDVLSLTE